MSPVAGGSPLDVRQKYEMREFTPLLSIAIRMCGIGLALFLIVATNLPDFSTESTTVLSRPHALSGSTVALLVTPFFLPYSILKPVAVFFVAFLVLAACGGILTIVGIRDTLSTASQLPRGHSFTFFAWASVLICAFQPVAVLATRYFSPAT